MIFTREISDPLTSLVKKIDEATAKNKSARMGSFVVFLGDDEEETTEKLKALAKKEGLDNCILTIDNPAGPQGYKIAKDAGVTVLLYRRHTVQANHAFRPGELNDAGVERVLADLPKILSKD